MHAFEVLAEALRYPYLGQIESLESGAGSLPQGQARTAYIAFVRQLTLLSLPQREELYTRTLDLNPLSAPYVGFQIYGESYQRGNFMSVMNRELAAHAISTEGELPDHLMLVLRYLAIATQPVQEVVEALPRSVQAMQRSLKRAEPDNPYGSLLEAVMVACTNLKIEKQAEPG